MAKIKKLKIAICSVLIAIIVLSASVCTGLFTTKNASAVSGNWKDYITGVSLTLKDGFYLIESPNQLAYFNENLKTYVSANIKLANDIDLSAHYWSPNTSAKFKGVFEGNNHIITGLTISGGSNVGLFATIDYDGQVQNLTIRTVSITGATGYAGAICGYLEGLKNKTSHNLFNCKILDCSITYNGVITPNQPLPNRPGGSIEYMSNIENLSATTLATDNNTTIYAGGIAGFSYTSKIINCYVNNLTISHAGGLNIIPTNCYVGGIVGRGANIQVEVCCIEGDSALTSTASSNCYAGGIVGELCQANSSTVTTKIDKCYFAGTSVSAGLTTCSSSYAGGIVGMLSYGSVSNCYNLAQISAQAKVNKSSNTTFDAWDSSKQDSTGWRVYLIKDSGNFKNRTYYICRGTRTDNNAKGSYKNTSNDSYYYTETINSAHGGIVGNVCANTSVSQCYNEGTINVQDNSGYKQYYYHFYFKMLYANLTNVHYYNWEPIHYSATLGAYYNAGGIAGKNSGTVNTCYGKNDSKTKTRRDNDLTYHNEISIELEQTYKNVLGQNVACEISSSASLNASLHEDDFYMSIYVVGKDTRYTYVYDINRESYSSVSPYNTPSASIANDFSSVWAINSEINGGNPIIKDFYWIYDGSKPA